MAHAENLKKKISYTILCLLFGFSLGVIFLFGVINMKNAELRSDNIADIEKQEETVSDSQTKEDCIITNDRTSEDGVENSDVLFVGCTGFF